MATLLSLGLAGCSKSPVEAHIESSIGHLQAAHDMLRSNAPSLEKLSIAVVQYRSKHKGEFTKLRVEGERMLKAMDDTERKALSAAAKKRALPIVQGIEAAAALYPDQRMAMRVVRPLVVTATPKGLPRGKQPPWMPKMPKVDPNALPPGLAGQGAGHGTPPAALMKKGAAPAKDPHAGHGHGPGQHHGALPPSELLKAKKVPAAPGTPPPTPAPTPAPGGEEPKR